MLKLAGYNIATLQGFVQILHAIEQENMSVSLAKTTLENEVRTRAGVTRLANQRSTRSMNVGRPVPVHCPDCGKLAYYDHADVMGLDIKLCNACGFSEVVA